MTDPFLSDVDASLYLQQAGTLADEEIDIFECALAFSLLDKPQTDIALYRHYFQKMHKTLSNDFEALCSQRNSDDVTVQSEALANTMAGEGYRSDDETYDDFDNINLFTVIDRKRGLQISLCIIAISLARSAGWHAKGVNFPGHFLMRLDHDGQRLLLDPYNEFTDMGAKDLRDILKRTIGERAELSADHYAPCTNRDILLRYQNNIKYRLIDAEKYDDALEVVQRMTLVAPADLRLTLDKAVLYARIGQTKAAIDSAESYLERVKSPQDKAEAAAFLRELQNLLN